MTNRQGHDRLRVLKELLQEFRKLRESPDRQWLLMIGLGLALLPIHNKALTDLATLRNGETVMFIPAIGYVLAIMGTGFFLVDNWKRVRQAGWGDWKVVTSLLVIALSMAISGFLPTNTTGPIAPFLTALFLLAMYLTSRVLGASIFRMMIPFVLIGTITAIVLEIVDPYNLTGGLITNSCALAGFLIIGTLTNRVKYQWVLCLVAVTGILLIGGLEGMLIVAVMGVVVIVRRDVSRWFWLTTGVALMIVASGALFRYMIPIYINTRNLTTLWGLVTGSIPLTTQTLDVLTTGRWTINMDVLKNISFLGHGFTLVVGKGIAHNIPLIIIDQIGIPAGIAWSFTTLYCLVKTNWKYLWIAVIAMSFWDHYLWSQFLPYFFCFVGFSLLPNTETDLIFRTET